MGQKLGPWFRATGQSTYHRGHQLQGEQGQQDRLVPSLRCIPVSARKYPKLLSSDWVAPNVVAVGDIEMAEGSSLWHGVVLRGDQAKISIGKNAVVQDNVHIKSSNGEPVTIGENSYIGAGSKLDQCTVEPFAYVGVNARIEPGVTVESYAIVASGAVVKEGTVVKSGQVFAGSPAKYLRDVSQHEKHLINEHMLDM